MKILFLKNETRNIEGKDYCKITVYDYDTNQLFNFYHPTNEKVYNLVKDCKIGTDITDKLGFVIKRGGKISFDIK